MTGTSGLPPAGAAAPTGESAADDLSLRAIGPFDLDCTAALHAACFDDAWSPAAIAALLATPGSFGVLSIAGEAPAGFLLARVAADESEILSIGVLPDLRRSGIARRMLAWASARAGESGAARLFLEVAADNHAARALYLREGFAQVGRRAGYYRRGAAPHGAGAVDALILARPVVGPVSGMT